MNGLRCLWHVGGAGGTSVDAVVDFLTIWHCTQMLDIISWVEFVALEWFQIL